MKAFFVACVFALATLCAAKDNGPYHLVPKMKCDIVQEMNTFINGTEVRGSTKIHGNFTITTTPNGIELVRPDIFSPDGGNAGFMDRGSECVRFGSSNYKSFVFEHREETTYNKHKCFRYFNDSDMSVWIDKDNVVWGAYMKENGLDTWSNFTYPKEPHTPSMFKFGETSACSQYAEVLKAPNDTFFYGMCVNDGASHLLGSLFLTVVALLFFIFF